MRDVLGDSSAWLDSKRNAWNAKTITYQRGEASITNLVATIGRTPFTVDSGNLVTEWESRDFIVSRSLLVLDDVQIVPERGDLIVETQGEETFTYEVSAPGKEPCYSTDPHRRAFRIHTKLKASG